MCSIAGLFVNAICLNNQVNVSVFPDTVCVCVCCCVSCSLSMCVCVSCCACARLLECAIYIGMRDVGTVCRFDSFGLLVCWFVGLLVCLLVCLFVCVCVRVSVC